jgi:hypothetical protein
MNKKIAILVVLLILFVLFAAFGVLQGLTADLRFKESNVDISSISTIGVLDVLTADVNMIDDITIGASSSPQYKRNFSKKGTAVYSVNLEKIEVFYSESVSGTKTVFMKLPKLEVKLYIDERTTNQIAEYQKKGWTGNAEDGFRTYMKTAESGYEEMKKSLQQYDGLMMQAEESAIERISQLASAVFVENAKFEVFFETEGRTKR